MLTFARRQNHAQQQSSPDGTRLNGVASAARHSAHDTPHPQHAAPFTHDFSGTPVHARTPITIQAKLAVNAPGDVYEQEADEISEEVLHMPEPQPRSPCAGGGGCRTWQAEGPGHKREGLQTTHLQSAGSDRTTAPPTVYEALSSPGQPLAAATRAFMEPRFGHDFSGVRVHFGPLAEQSTRDVNANAYTVGQHMVFGAGRFAPETHYGRRLIAHELTHVVQQSSAHGSDVGHKRDLSRGFQNDVIQREPAEEAPPAAPHPPSFARATPSHPLPGDPVPGVTDKKTPYTKTDWKLLKDALFTRRQQNQKNARQFVVNFSKAMLQVWSAYVAEYATEEMLKAAEDQGSFLFKLAGFIVRDGLIFVLFPEVELASVAEKVAVELVKASLTFSGEWAQGRAEESMAEEGLEKRGREIKHTIHSQTPDISKLLDVLGPVVDQVAVAADYQEWIDDHESSLADLVSSGSRRPSEIFHRRRSARTLHKPSPASSTTRRTRTRSRQEQTTSSSSRWRR